MNVYLFVDGDADFVIVVAVSLQSAEGLLDRAADQGDFGGAFTNSTRTHIPVDDVLNVYTLKQQIRDANTTSERILFEVD